MATEIESLRNKYRWYRTKTSDILGGVDDNDFFDATVKTMMEDEGLEPTPTNWVSTAKALYENTRDHEEGYFEDHDDNDRYMGYDTLEERNMDREWD